MPSHQPPEPRAISSSCSDFMAKYVIVPIVEGHGEVDAVPTLLQRWLRFRRYRNVEVHVDGPVRGREREP